MATPRAIEAATADGAGSRWTVHDLELGTGYVGAVAVEGEAGVIRVQDPLRLRKA